MSNRRVVFAFTLAFCGAIASATAVAASDGPPPVLNPKTYTSPSGAYKLDVDPSNMHGQGGGTYRLTRHGEEVWSGQRALTLWECTVTDDGAAAGYAYSQGPDGGPVSKAGDTNFGSFHVVIRRIGRDLRRAKDHGVQAGGCHQQ